MLTCGVLAGLMWVVCAAAQGPSSQPAPPAGPSLEQRLNDYVALIEGPNLPLTARRTGARELLCQGWPETAGRLATILAGQNPEARKAVALALADLPQALADIYINPLIAMLSDPDPDTRHATAAALAGYRDSGVTARLRGIMLDEAQPSPLRLTAVETLGMMTRREAVAALVEALQDPGAPICQPALEALEQITAMSFREDPAGARAWWEKNRQLPLPEWQQSQIDRLVQKDRESTRRLHELEVRLVEAYRQDYIRAAEAQRGPRLQGYLADTSALVRLLGLDLVRSHLGEGKTLSAEAVAQMRALLTDPEPQVRAEAVRAVVRLREMGDADRFLELLGDERHVEVRRALVNGLGYLGTDAVAPALLALLSASEDPCLTEAVAAVGRLAERGVLGEQPRSAVADALLATFNRTQPAQAELRERVLWAMSLVADPRFGQAFAAALADSKAAAVRQTAVRGIAVLKDPELADTLVPVTKDPDLTTRRAAVETLAELGSTSAHLAALWDRVVPGQESDESVQQAAWQGAVRVASARPATEIEQWIADLPHHDPGVAERWIELLDAVATSLAKNPEARGDMGRLRALIATERARLGQPAEAVAAYLAALGDLHAAQSADIPRLSLELLRFALVNGRYDQAVASALAGGNPSPDGTALWEGVRPDIEQRLTPEAVDQAIVMLEALQAHPPAALAPEVAQAIAEMLQRARGLKSPPPTSAPASQPAGPPASQPVTPPTSQPAGAPE